MTIIVAGETDAGQATLDEAETFLERTGERWWDTEIYRLRGKLVMAQDGDCAEAERLFRKALALAGDRGARSFELRAAMSLARLWQQQGKAKEALELLTPIHAWFTEGLDTADLEAARSLMDALRATDSQALAD